MRKLLPTHSILLDLYQRKQSLTLESQSLSHDKISSKKDLQLKIFSIIFVMIFMSSSRPRKVPSTLNLKRILQNELSHISSEYLEMLLGRIYPYLTELMMDTYGNYFCQRLIKACNVKQRIKIFDSVNIS